MKKTILLIVLFGLTFSSGPAFAGSCQKLQLIHDAHFASECAFDRNNAGTFDENATDLRLVVKCYHISENPFTWGKVIHKQFTYDVKRVDAISGISTSRDEDDQYFTRVEASGNTVKLTTWSVRVGKRAAQTSTFQCIR